MRRGICLVEAVLKLLQVQLCMEMKEQGAISCGQVVSNIKESQNSVCVLGCNNLNLFS